MGETKMSLITLPKFDKSTLPKLMTRKDIMNLFHISKSTLHRWTNEENKLKSFPIGRRIYFKMDDVQEMIEENYTLNTI